MTTSFNAPSEIVFLFGTETGVSEEFAFTVAGIVASKGVRVAVLPVDEYPIELWGSTENSSPIVFFISTAGQGEMPLSMRQTWEVLRMSDAPDLPSECRYAVFGLGDSTYSKYNYAAKMFHNRLQQLGATPIVHRGLGDERDGKGIAQELSPWLDLLWEALGLAGLMADTAGSTAASVASTDNNTTDNNNNNTSNSASSTFKKLAIPIPKNKFTIADAFPSAGTTGLTRTESDNARVAAGDTPASNSIAPETTPATTPDTGAAFAQVPRPGCWQLTVANNTRLTSSSHFQHVSFVEFARESGNKDRSDYLPGDCLALYPTNSSEAVSRILKALKISATEADTRWVVVSPNTSWGLVRQTARPFVGVPILIRDLLTRFIDLEGIASQTFLRMFSACATRIDDVELVERMRDLGTPSNCEDYNSFAYREKRTMAEVLEDFPSVPVTLEELISNAPVMRPRYYSISTSPTMDVHAIGVTVALFHIKTPLGRDRTGLCSRWLCRSVAGDTIEGQFLRRPFEIHPKAPLILIGPGTGVAPLRSIIRERAAQAANATDSPTTPPADMILFFGCRNKSGDFLHGNEWEQFAPSLKVVTAFSRDDASGKKEYVQHKLIEDSAAATKVFKLLTNTDADLYGGGGVVIICGNAKHMPNSVQDALASILAAGKGISKDDALTEVNRLRIRGRIKFETWSV